MRLDLAERLRCPSRHAATPLVVVAAQTRERELVEGFAGCPVCQLEVRIAEGQLRFDGRTDYAEPLGATTATAPDLDRVVALLGLAEPSGAVLLTGRYAALAEPLAATTGVAAVVMCATHVPVASEELCAVLGAPRAVPFTDGTFRAAALDASLPPELLADLPRVVAPLGRVLADVAVTPPLGLSELARDDREWVAARDSARAMVELRRSTR